MPALSMGREHERRARMTDRQLQPTDRWRTRHARALRALREEGISGLTRRFEEEGAWSFLKEKARFELCSMFERFWDRMHHVDTSGQIDLENIEVVGENRLLGNSFRSTSPRTFRLLAAFFPADRSNYTFIDVGCGKGRAVLLASQLGFNRVIGLEFSPWIAQVAKNNIRTFRGNRAGLGCSSIVIADALEYQLPNEPLMLYLYTPFQPELLDRFFDKVTETFDKNQKPIVIFLVGHSLADVAARRLKLSGRFRVIREGTAPYFLDACLPFKYYSFEVC
jgi:SAM-dependent methyltransferase